jgi:hypothetical protein
MRRRVPERTKQSDDQIHQAGLLATLAFRRERIEGKARIACLADPKRIANQFCAIGSEAGFLAQLLSDAFGGLEYGMKIIIDQQLRLAELDNVGMNATLDESLR